MSHTTWRFFVLYICENIRPMRKIFLFLILISIFENNAHAQRVEPDQNQLMINAGKKGLIGMGIAIGGAVLINYVVTQDQDPLRDEVKSETTYVIGSALIVTGLIFQASAYNSLRKAGKAGKKEKSLSFTPTPVGASLTLRF